MVEPTTIECYGKMLKHLIRHIGTLAVTEVEPHHIRRMLQEVGRTRSSGTVRNLKIVASEMFKIAIQDKLWDDNPVAGIKVRAPLAEAW